MVALNSGVGEGLTMPTGRHGSPHFGKGGELVVTVSVGVGSNIGPATKMRGGVG